MENLNLKISVKKNLLPANVKATEKVRGSMLTKASEISKNSSLDNENAYNALSFLSLECFDEYMSSLSEDHLSTNSIKLPYQKVTAIGIMKVQSEKIDGFETLAVRDIACSAPVDFDEKQILSGFWSYLEKSRSKIITYNGRGYLVPVLRYRSMKHQLSCQYFSNTNDKWSGYMNRYSLNQHIDLMDVLSDFKSSSYSSLENTCKALNIPFLEKDTEETVQSKRKDAENKVISNYLLYSRWKLFTGDMNSLSYAQSIGNLLNYLITMEDKKFFLENINK